MTLEYDKEEYEILDRLIAGETVRTIKTAMRIGAEKIQKVREANPDKIPKKKAGTRTRTGTRTIFIPDATTSFETFKKSRIYFTNEEKDLARKLFRTALRHRSIKVQNEEKYQKLIDKITGD